VADMPTCRRLGRACGRHGPLSGRPRHTGGQRHAAPPQRLLPSTTRRGHL